MKDSPSTRWPDVREPAATIYGRPWTMARAQLRAMERGETRRLLRMALNHVERGWNAVRELQLWVEDNADRARQDDDYGALLSYGETELRDTFRCTASMLCGVVGNWPGGEQASIDDVEGWAEAFVRNITVVHLATEAATVPPPFRELVHQVADLRGAWAAELRVLLDHMRSCADAEGQVRDGRWAMETLLRDLPSELLQSSCAHLLGDVERLHRANGRAPPEWLDRLRAHYR